MGLLRAQVKGEVARFMDLKIVIVTSERPLPKERFREHFMSCGEIIEVVLGPEASPSFLMSRGHVAFIVFTSEWSRQAALALDGAPLDGVVLRVEYAGYNGSYRGNEALGKATLPELIELAMVFLHHHEIEQTLAGDAPRSSHALRRQVLPGAVRNESTSRI